MPMIIPSILVYSKEKYLKQIQAIKSMVDFVQVDIANNTFVPNQTWYDPGLIEENIPFDFELHMMIEKPMDELGAWMSNDRLKRVVLHFETIENAVPQAIKIVHESGRQISICLNPETPISVLEPFVNDIDAVQFMTIEPGFQGQPFLPEVLDKIKKYKNKHPDHFISADGHVNEETIPLLIEVGVEGLCIGSAIFNEHSEPKDNILRIQKLINSLTK